MSEDCNPGPSLRWGELYVSTQSQMTTRGLKLGRAALNETRKDQRCSLPRNVPNLFLLEAPCWDRLVGRHFPLSTVLCPSHPSTYAPAAKLHIARAKTRSWAEELVLEPAAQNT